jgi:hypothetical protein
VTMEVGSDLATGVIRLRPTRWQWAAREAWFVFLLCIMAPAFVLNDPKRPWSGLVVMVLLAFAWGALLGLHMFRLGLTVTPDVLVAHGWSCRVIAWRDIERITIQGSWDRKSVWVQETSGRKTKLRAPATGWLNWDRNFDAKFRWLGEWYMAHSDR